MSKPVFVKFETPADLSDRALEAIRRSRDKGKVKKGTNEVTKVVERGKALLVVIAEDVQPPEVVAHLPLLCDEKKVPYLYVKSKKSLGEAVGLEVPTAAAAIVDGGDAASLVQEVAEKAASLKGQKRAEAGLNFERGGSHASRRGPDNGPYWLHWRGDPSQDARVGRSRQRKGTHQKRAWCREAGRHTSAQGYRERGKEAQREEARCFC